MSNLHQVIPPHHPSSPSLCLCNTCTLYLVSAICTTSSCTCNASIPRVAAHSTRCIYASSSCSATCSLVSSRALLLANRCMSMGTTSAPSCLMHSNLNRVLPSRTLLSFCCESVVGVVGVVGVRQSQSYQAITTIRQSPPVYKLAQQQIHHTVICPCGISSTAMREYPPPNQEGTGVSGANTSSSVDTNPPPTCPYAPTNMPMRCNTRTHW